MSDEEPSDAAEIIRLNQAGRRDFSGLELDRDTLDFRGAHLVGIQFGPGSYIVADFRDADLRGADLSHCNLKTCDFRGADLRNASFRGSPLDATEFAGAATDGADFEGASNQSLTLGPQETPSW